MSDVFVYSRTSLEKIRLLACDDVGEGCCISGWPLQAMSQATNPYGDGQVSARIVAVMQELSVEHAAETTCY